MRYKVGDKVLIKTWDELVEEFGMGIHNRINMPSLWWPKEYDDDELPKDRIITITQIDKDGDYIYNDSFVFKEMIKEKVIEYKTGDKVLLYTWGELVDMFGLDEKDTIMIHPNIDHWSLYNDYYLPKNRIVILEDDGNIPFYSINGESSEHCIYKEMIKEKVIENTTNITLKQFVDIKLGRAETITLNRETLVEWIEDYIRIQKGE